MKNLYLHSLVLSCLLSTSCGSLPTQDELDRWKANTEKALAAAAQIADAANAGVATAKAKIDELEAKHAGILAEIESLAGPLDQNGDGDVTAKEASAVYAELRKTPEGQSVLSNWETYAAVIASVLGIGVAKRPAQALLAKVHSTGRALVNTNGKPPEA